MQNKRKKVVFLIIILIFLFSVFIYIFYFSKIVNISEIFKRKEKIENKLENPLQKAIEDSVFSNDEITLFNSSLSLVENIDENKSSLNDPNVSEDMSSKNQNVQEQVASSDTNTDINTTTNAQTNVNTSTTNDKIKKIKCTMKVKKGSKNKLAKVSWNCSNYNGWSCKLKNDDEILIENIKFPSDIQEVKAKTAEMKITTNTCPSYYNSLGGPHPSCPSSNSQIEAGLNWYSLKCISLDGKIAKFEKNYFNYNF